MTEETVLRRLAKIPRPQLPPFWAARVTARATGTGRTPATPPLMWVYWTTLAAIGGPLLLTSWERLVALAAGVAMVNLLRYNRDLP